MERLAEQIVDWHNRHPLARRIRVDDVHTVGVVALPFVRASADSTLMVEPVLTDVVSAFDDLQGAAPLSRAAALLQGLRSLPERLAQRFGRKPRTQWRAFSEKFLPGLSPRRVEAFALAHGFEDPPASPETRPWRVIVIDERLASARHGWPFELYLMSAGIDVGSARTRVLSGRGIPSQVLGRRLWDPKRVGAAAALLALGLGSLLWLAWPSKHPAPDDTPAATAEAPAPHPATSAVTAASPASAVAPTAAASAAEAASSPGLPASATGGPLAGADGASAAADAGSAPPPDIRPRLVERSDGKPRPPLLRSAEVVATPTAPRGDGVGPGAAKPPAGEKADAKSGDTPDPQLRQLARSPEKVAVALVGPPGTKAEAEALLAKMKDSLAGVHGNPEALQADVIQTPEGWRATVWPFSNREQAQLINATLVARGLKTKAVNF